MLSPRYLDGLSDEIIEIYSQLESDILQDMARRIARLGKVTETTRWQAQMLAEAGGLKKNIGRILAKYDKAVIRQVKDTFAKALETSVKNDNRIFKAATGRMVSAPNAQQMLSTIQKCHSDLSRLTLTTAMTTQTQFVQQANRVYMMTQSGAFDYDTAMKTAADELARRGITTVEYNNGRPVTRSIESAVRMNILTSVNQTAANQTLSNAEELGAERFEVTAHVGSRPEHEAWQGKVWTREQLYTVCGLGDVTGLCGINCRHSFYPYFEGMAEHYTEKELDEMAGEEVSYNGQKMTRYEGEQKLRGIERNIRHWKRQALTEEAAGVDNTRARQKLGEWQAAARDFTNQTGIARDSAREYIGTPDGKQPIGIKPPTALSAQTAPNTPTKAVKVQGVNAMSDKKLLNLVSTAKTEDDTVKIGAEIIRRATENNTDYITQLKHFKAFGTTAPLVMQKGSSKYAKDEIQKALLFYPENAGNDIVKFFANVKAKKTQRGYFSYSRKEISISSRKTVAVHELAHTLEHLHPWIVQAESDFYSRRTSGEALKSLKSVTGLTYSSTEMTRTDKFIHPYIGKDYGGSAWEIFSMGVEQVFFEKYSTKGVDKDFESFILGIIMRL